MKKILISLGIIGIVSVVAVSGTVAYFSDTESSVGNTFSAGEIDLKIDLQCDTGGCGFPEKDLAYDPFFYRCDIKPGDKHEATVSFHVYNNNAWGRVKLDQVKNWEYGCTEPEAVVDSTCQTPGDNYGELPDNLKFTIWLDQGIVPGWNCPKNQPRCTADPKEGNNILDGNEIPLITDIPASQLMSGWYVFPEEIQASSTYYVGIEWRVPAEVGNIIQTDSIQGNIIMQVVQSRNNPDKQF